MRPTNGVHGIRYPTVWMDDYGRCWNIFVLFDRRFLCKFIVVQGSSLVTVVCLHFPEIRSKGILLLKLKYWISKINFKRLKYEYFRCSHWFFCLFSNSIFKCDSQRKIDFANTNKKPKQNKSLNGINVGACHNLLVICFSNDVVIVLRTQKGLSR